MRLPSDRVRTPRGRSNIIPQARPIHSGEDAHPADYSISFGDKASQFAAVVFSLLLFLVLPNIAVSAGINRDSVINRTNAIRQTLGRPPLRRDNALAAAAQQRAEELAAASLFEHRRPNGAPFATAVIEAGYPFERVAENLALAYFNEAPLINGWLGSVSHRQSILNNKYAHIGIGVATGTISGVPATIVVQLLGQSSAPELRGWSRLPSALSIG